MQDNKSLGMEFIDVEGASLEGKTLAGLYHVKERIGQGGMAWVYRATHTQLGGDVAIKLLFSEFTADEAKKERFLREAKIQNQLDHPNIVRVQNVIQYLGMIGFVMEWCNGGNLLQWLKKAHGPLSLEQIQALFPPLADALGYAHGASVIHRDLKPQNILLHISGNTIIPKVADFGIAKMLQTVGLTRPGELMGTLEYAAPEQLKDSRSVDHRTDIYSLGVLLYRMATGRLPFSGSPSTLIKQVTELPPAPPEEAPIVLHEILYRCLAKSPSARYQSCAELKQAFSDATALKDSAGSLRAIVPGIQQTDLPTVDVAPAKGSSEPKETTSQPGDPLLEASSAMVVESNAGKAPTRLASAQISVAPDLPAPAPKKSDDDFYLAIEHVREEEKAKRQRILLFSSMLVTILLLLGVIVYLLMRR